MSNSDSSTVSSLNANGALKLEDLRASSEARRRRILANAEARLKAITGGSKPAKSQRSIRPEASANSPPDSSHDHDCSGNRPLPTLRTVKPSFEPDTAILERGSFFKNRVDFLVMLCVGFITRLYLVVSDTHFNLLGAYAVVATPLVALSVHLAPPSGNSAGLHKILLETLFANGRPLVQRVSVVLAIFRTAFEYLAAYLFSFILVHVFLGEWNAISE